MLQSQIVLPWAQSQLQGSVPLLGSEEGRRTPHQEKQKPSLTLPANKASAVPLSQGQAKNPHHGQRKLLKNPPEKIMEVL